MFELFFFQRTDRNFYKLVHGERTHEPSYTSLSLFAILVLFPVIVMQSEKNPLVLHTYTVCGQYSVLTTYGTLVCIECVIFWYPIHTCYVWDQAVQQDFFIR